LQSGEARQLTTGTASEWNPQWSPDGNQIAFISTRGGPPQVYVSPVDGGEARPLTFLKRGVGGVPLWSPDGNQIAFTASAKDEARDPRKPYRITRFIHRVDGMGNVDDGIQDIYVTNTKGGEVKRLTEVLTTNRPLPGHRMDKSCCSLPVCSPIRPIRIPDFVLLILRARFANS